MAKRINSLDWSKRPKGPLSKLLLVGASMAGLQLDYAHAVQIQSQQKASSTAATQSTVEAMAGTQSQQMIQQQIQTVNQMMTKAYEHATQMNMATSQTEQKALSEAELNSKMLEFISSSTFDSMMELNNEEMNGRTAHKKHQPEKETRDSTLVQTHQDLQNKTQSDLKSLVQGGCFVGKEQDCLYPDQTSLVQGNLSEAAKKKISNMQFLKAKLTAKAKALKAAKLKAAKLAKEKAAAKAKKTKTDSVNTQKNQQETKKTVIDEKDQPKDNQKTEYSNVDLQLQIPKLKEKQQKEVGTQLENQDNINQHKKSGTLSEKVENPAFQKKENDQAGAQTSKDMDDLGQLPKQQEEVKHETEKTQKSIKKASKQEDSSPDKLKLEQSDQEVSQAPGTIASDEKDISTPDQTPQKTSSDTFTLESLEARAQSEFQHKKIEKIALAKKTEKKEQNDSKTKSKKTSKTTVADLKSLQKRIAKKVNDVKKSSNQVKTAVKALVKQKKKDAESEQALTQKKQMAQKSETLNEQEASETHIAAKSAEKQKNSTKSQKKQNSEAIDVTLESSQSDGATSKKSSGIEIESKEAASRLKEITVSKNNKQMKSDSQKKGPVLVKHFYKKLPSALNQKKGRADEEKTKCAECPKCQKPAEPLLVQLAHQGYEFSVPTSDENNRQQKNESMMFQIIPKSFKETVTSDVQVLSSERVLGFSTYSDQDKQITNQDSNNDYYNVTVSLIVKRAVDGSSPEHPLEQQKAQQSPESQPSKVTTKKKSEPNDSNLASSSFAAAASLTSNLVQESNAELAESENYTSKIAKAQAQSQDLVAQKDTKKAANKEQGEEKATEDVKEIHNVDLNQISEQEGGQNNEEKPVTTTSLQTTPGSDTPTLSGELDPSQVKIEGIAAAVELNNHFLQINQNMHTRASSQVDEQTEGKLVNELLVESDSDSDQTTDEHDQAVEQETRHANDHKKFMQRIHMRELAQKKAWANENEEDLTEEFKAKKEQNLAQKEDSALDGMASNNINDTVPAEDPEKLKEQKEIEESAAEDEEQEKAVMQKETLDKVYEATKEQPKQNPNHAQKKQKSNSTPVFATQQHISQAETEEEQEQKQEEAEKKENDEDLLKETVIANPETKVRNSSKQDQSLQNNRKQIENNQIKQLPQTEQQKTLQKLRSALETKIQSEINQLNQVVAMQDGDKSENRFDYELVKVVKDEDESPKSSKSEQAKENKEDNPKKDMEEEDKKQQESTDNTQEEKKQDENQQIKEEVEARIKQKLLKTDNSNQSRSQALTHKNTSSRARKETMALQNDSQIETSVEIQSKQKNQKEVKDKRERNAKNAANAQADAKKAKEIRIKAQQEAEIEQQKRMSLIEKAEALAQQDLKAKAQIKESAKVAAIIKMKKAKALKEKLQAEAKEWIAKKEQFDKEEEQARKAQKEAEEAAEKLAKEKAAVEAEAKERQKLHQIEQEKAKQKIIEARNAENEAKLVAKRLVNKHQKTNITLTDQLKSEQVGKSDNKKEIIKIINSNHQNYSELDQKEIDQIQEDLKEAQIKSDAYSKEQDIGQDINQQLESNNMISSKVQSQITQRLAAEDQVEKAKQIGEQNGKQEAQKLIEIMKTQTMEQNQNKVEQLKKKLISTSQQVQLIVNNFQSVHQELVDLRLDYQQQQMQAKSDVDSDDSNIESSINIPEKQNKLQISGFINLRQATKAQEYLESIRDKISHKQQLVKKIVKNLHQLKTDLMQVELPQIDYESSKDQEEQLNEIKEFRDQIFLQIQTSTLIAQNDLNENMQKSQVKVNKIDNFKNTLKSSLIQYLEQMKSNQ